MADDALAFLEKWIEDNAAATPVQLRAEKAESLAEECRKAAENAGFSEDELDEAIAELADGEDLSTYLEEVLDRVVEEDTEDEEEEEEA